MKELKPHYSGSLSMEFWKIVNSLPEPEQNEMYFAGVLLQNMEGHILSVLSWYAKEHLI